MQKSVGISHSGVSFSGQRVIFALAVSCRLLSTGTRLSIWVSLESMEVMSCLVHIGVALGFCQIDFCASGLQILLQIGSSL